MKYRNHGIVIVLAALLLVALVPLPAGTYVDSYAQQQDMDSGSLEITYRDRTYELLYDTTSNIQVASARYDTSSALVIELNSTENDGILELTIPSDFIEEELMGLPPIYKGKVSTANGRVVADAPGIYVAGAGTVQVAETSIISAGCSDGTTLMIKVPAGTYTVTIDKMNSLTGIAPTLSATSSKCAYPLGEDVQIEGNFFNSYPEGTEVVLTILSTEGTVVDSETLQIEPLSNFSSSFSIANPGLYIVNATDSKFGLVSSDYFVVGEAAVFPLVVQGQRFDVGVSTNSSEYGVRLKIIDRQLQFVAAGEAGTAGHAELTIPKNLIDGLAVQEGTDESVSVSLEGNSTHNKIIMDYPHREFVESYSITATTVVPEFPLPLLAAVAAMGGAVVLTRRKGLK